LRGSDGARSEEARDMSDARWQPASFRDVEVWVHLDANGAMVKDSRGLVEFRYQVGGKSYHTHGDRLSLKEGAGVPADASPLPRKSPSPSRSKAVAPSGPTGLAADTIEIWTDGACSGNPGPAGLGVHLRRGAIVEELSEYIGEGTNNIAELMAIQRGLEMVGDPTLPVAVMTDSAYSLGLLTKGWKPKKNQELVAEIRAVCAPFTRLTFVKVAGHAGIEGNERADLLARRAIETRTVTRSRSGD